MTRHTTAHLAIRIPYAELRGTEAEKLVQLDAILARLRDIRLGLAASADDAAARRSPAVSFGVYNTGFHPEATNYNALHLMFRDHAARY